MRKTSVSVKKSNLEAYNTFGFVGEPKGKFWIIVENYYYGLVYGLIDKHLGVKDKRVCELGCGTAAHLKWYKRDCQEIIGLDISREMLKLYARTEGKAQNLALIVGDALTLPFKLGAFDIVTIYESAHHFPCIYRCMDEMIRVAGSFAFLEPNRDSLLHRILEWKREKYMNDGRFTTKHPYTLVEFNSLGFSATQIKRYLRTKKYKVQVHYVFTLPMEISAMIMRRSRLLFKIISLFGQGLTRIPLFKSQFGNLLIIASPD